MPDNKREIRVFDHECLQEIRTLVENYLRGQISLRELLDKEERAKTLSYQRRGNK